MTNEQIFELINFISNKDQSGKTLKPEQFNVILPAACLEFAKMQRQGYEKNQEVTNAIKHLKVFDSNLTVNATTGIATVPTNYSYGGQLWYNDSVPQRRKIDLVTDAEFNLRMGSPLRKGTAKKPLAKLVGGYLYFEPKTLGSSVKFSYLKGHTTPVLDYYFDTNDIAIFFSDPADVDTWVAGSYDTGDEVYYNGHYYTCDSDGISSTPSIVSDWIYTEKYTHALTGDELGSGEEVATTVVDTQTVEMDWRDEDKLIIADMILKKIGINLKKPELIQYVQLQQQERVL